MKIDPAAVVKCRPVLVDLGGTVYRIEARPAGEWLVPILEKGWAEIVPGMLDAAVPADRTLDDLYDDLTEGTVTTAECEKAAQSAVSAVSGMKWWAAVKLIHAGASDPGVIGELRLSGVDLTTAPLGAVVAGLYRIYTRDTDPKDVAKLDAELMRTPAGVSATERFDEDEAAEAFERMFSGRGGR